MSFENDFEFLMQLRIETDDAMGKITNVWDTMKELSSRTIGMKLEVRADYQDAMRGLDETKKKLNEVNVEIERQEASAKAAAVVVAQSFDRMNQAIGSTGTNLKRALDTGDIEKATRAIEQFVMASKSMDLTNLRQRDRSGSRDLPQLFDTLAKGAEGAKALSPRQAAHLDEAKNRVREASRMLADAVTDEDYKSAQNYLEATKKALIEGAEKIKGSAIAYGQVITASADLNAEIVGLDRALAAESAKPKPMTEVVTRLKDAGNFLRMLSTGMDEIQLGDMEGISQRANVAQKSIKAVFEGQIGTAGKLIAESFADAARSYSSSSASDSIAQLREVREESKKAYANLHEQMLTVMSQEAVASVGALAGKVGGDGGIGGMLQKMLPALLGKLDLNGLVLPNGTNGTHGEAARQATKFIPELVFPDGGVLLPINQENLVTQMKESFRLASEAIRVPMNGEMPYGRRAGDKTPDGHVRLYDMGDGTYAHDRDSVPKGRGYNYVDVPKGIASGWRGADYRDMASTDPRVRYNVPEGQRVMNAGNGIVPLTNGGAVDLTQLVKFLATTAPRNGNGGRRGATTLEGEAGISELFTTYGGKPILSNSRQSSLEREYNDRVKRLDAIEVKAGKDRINSDPVGQLKELFGDKLGPEITGAMDKIKELTNKKVDPNDPKARETRRTDAEQVLQQWPKIADALVDVSRELLKGGDPKGSTLASAGLSRMSTLYKTPNDTYLRDKDEQEKRAAERAAMSRAAYTSDIKQRLLNTDAYKDFRDKPVDVMAQRADRYANVLQKISLYEREIIGLMAATTKEEEEAGTKRVNRALQALTIAKDELNIKLLSGERGTVASRKTVAQFGLNTDGSVYATQAFAKDAKGGYVTENVSLQKGYERSSNMLNENLMPAVEEFNKLQEAYRKTLIEEATDAYKVKEPKLGNELTEKASRVTEIGREKAVQFVLGNGSQREIESFTEAMAKTLKLTHEETQEYGQMLEMAKDMATADDIRLKIAQKRMATLRPEAELQTMIAPVIDQNRAQQDMLDRYGQLQGTKTKDPYGLRHGVSQAGMMLGIYGGAMHFGMMAHRSVQESMEYGKEISQIQGLMGGGATMGQDVSASVGKVASTYGTNLLETARAAKALAQEGMNATDMIKELDATMRGVRGLGMTVEGMKELQVSVHAVDDTITTSAIVEKLAAVTAKAPVAASQLAKALEMAGPLMHELSDGMRGSQDFSDYTLGASSILIEKHRYTGQQAGQSLKMLASRLLRPEVVTKLQSDYGLKMGDEQGNMLPINEIMKEVTTKYRELKASGKPGDGTRADAMLAQMAGARRATDIETLVSNYDKVIERADASTNSFGQSQVRTNLAMDTFGAKVEIARTGFQLFTNDFIQHSLIADGLKGSLEAVGVALKGLNGPGGSGMLTSLALVGAGTGLVKGGNKIYDRLGIARDASMMGVDYSTLRDGIDQQRTSARLAATYSNIKGAAGATTLGVQTAEEAAMAANGVGLVKAEGLMARVGAGMGKLSSGLGAVVTTLGPTLTIFAGLAAVLAVIGGLRWVVNRLSQAGDDANKYQVHLQGAKESGLYDSPQYGAYQNALERVGQNDVFRGFDMINGALNSDRMKSFAGRNGASSMYDLKDKADKGIVDGGAIASEMIPEFIKALSETGAEGKRAAEKLNAIQDPAERFALATKLASDSAQAMAWQMNQSMALFHDAVVRQAASMTTGLGNLHDSGRGASGWNTLFGNMMDEATGRKALESNITGYQTGMLSMHGIGASGLKTPQTGAAITGFIDQMGMPYEVKQAFLSSTGEFQKALRELNGEMAKSPDKFKTVGDVIAGIFAVMDRHSSNYRTIQEYALDDKGTLGTRNKRVGMQEAFEFDLAKSMIAQTGNEKVVRGIDANFTATAKGGAPTAENAFDSMMRTIEHAKAKAEEQMGIYGRGSNAALQYSKALTGVMELHKHAAIATFGGAEALTVFKDKMTDLLLGLYVSSHKIDAAKDFAVRHHEKDSEDTQRMGMYKNFAIEVANMNPTLESEKTKKQQELANLWMGTTRINGLTASTDDDDPKAKSAEGQRQKSLLRKESQLKAQIAAYEGEIKSIEDRTARLGDMLPEGKIKTWFTDMMTQYKAGSRGLTDLIAGLQKMADLGYEESANAEHKTKMYVDLLALRTQYAEKSADIARLELDLEPDIAKRQLDRERIARYVTDAKKQEIDLMVQAGEMDKRDGAQKKTALTNELTMNSVIERRMQYEQLLVEKRRQGQQNLTSTVSATLKGLTDMNAFGAIFEKSISGAEKGERVKRYWMGVIKGISGTFTERLNDNMAKLISDKLMHFSGMAKLFESPEVAVDQQIEKAGSIVVSGMNTVLTGPAITFADRLDQVFKAASIDLPAAISAALKGNGAGGASGDASAAAAAAAAVRGAGGGSTQAFLQQFTKGAQIGGMNGLHYATGPVYGALAFAKHADAATEATPETTPPGASSSTSNKAARVFAAGDNLLGTPFKMGSIEEQIALDCSGFVRNVFKKAGVNLQGGAADLAFAGKGVATKDMKAGDLMVFQDEKLSGRGEHVGIYAGNNKILHESSSGGMVRYDDLDGEYGRRLMSYLIATRRVLPDNASSPTDAYYQAPGAYKARTTAHERDPWGPESLGPWAKGVVPGHEASIGAAVKQRLAAVKAQQDSITTANMPRLAAHREAKAQLAAASQRGSWSPFAGIIPAINGMVVDRDSEKPTAQAPILMNGALVMADKPAGPIRMDGAVVMANRPAAPIRMAGAVVMADKPAAPIRMNGAFVMAQPPAKAVGPIRMPGMTVMAQRPNAGGMIRLGGALVMADSAAANRAARDSVYYAGLKSQYEADSQRALVGGITAGRNRVVTPGTREEIIGLSGGDLSAVAPSVGAPMTALPTKGVPQIDSLSGGNLAANREAGTLVPQTINGLSGGNIGASLLVSGIAASKARSVGATKKGVGTTSSQDQSLMKLVGVSAQDLGQYGGVTIKTDPKLQKQLDLPITKNKPWGEGQMMVMGLGQQVGNMAGTAAGGGGQWAQLGASLGSTGGMMAGMKLGTTLGMAGGPIGMAIGAGLGAVGGWLGGKLLGGMDKKQSDRAINRLEAIAFATRDTVTSIDQQTDKLTKPDSTLLNLPTNFVVPGYMPQFAGSANGAASVAASNGDSYQISIGDINVPNGGTLSKQDIQQAVETAVANAISDGRGKASRPTRKY